MDGRNKDAEFIMEYFSNKVDEFDPKGSFIDCFISDRAANVQNAGSLLCAKYPRVMFFYGGDHMLSLYFSDLEKLQPIQVS